MSVEGAERKQKIIFLHQSEIVFPPHSPGPSIVWNDKSCTRNRSFSSAMWKLWLVFHAMFILSHSRLVCCVEMCKWRKCIKWRIDLLKPPDRPSSAPCHTYTTERSFPLQPKSRNRVNTNEIENRRVKKRNLSQKDTWGILFALFSLQENENSHLLLLSFFLRIYIRFCQYTKRSTKLTSGSGVGEIVTLTTFGSFLESFTKQQK